MVMLGKMKTPINSELVCSSFCEKSVLRRIDYRKYHFWGKRGRCEELKEGNFLGEMFGNKGLNGADIKLCKILKKVLAKIFFSVMFTFRNTSGLSSAW